MSGYPSPSRGDVLAAFDAHGVRYRVEPITADSEGRPWSSGLRAIVDHHTAGSNSLSLLMNAGGSSPYVNTLIHRDGLVSLLSTRSCWGSGAGGPWSGVASKDQLHLVGWQNEVEDLGQGRTFTAAQLESLGRVNASLVSLGVPPEHEVNHRDWTDGTGGVGGYPLPTTGRKVDTRYSTDDLRANTARYARPTTPPTDEGNDLMLILRNVSTEAHALLSGSLATVLEDSRSVSNLKAAGVPVVNMPAVDYNRIVSEAR